MKRLDRIEVARGMAALVIVFYHASAIVQTPKYLGTVPFGGWAVLGGVGVDFFFVLSGFILYHVHRRDFGHPERVGEYCWKRFFRIYPPYWAATFAVLPIYFLQPGFGTGTERDPGQILSSLSLIPDGVTPILIVGWSLRYEVVFYAVFGLFLAHVGVGRGVMALWMAGCVGAVMLEANPGSAWGQILSLRNVGFPLGMGAAWWVLRRTGGGSPAGLATREGTLESGPVPDVGPRRAGGWLAGIGLAGMVAWGVVLHLGWVRYGLFTSLAGNYVAAGAAVAGLALRDLQASRRPAGWLRLLGEASYSIYLVHYPVLSAGGKAFRSLGLYAWLPAEGWFVALSMVAVAAGLVFHRWVEVPLLRLRTRSRRGGG